MPPSSSHPSVEQAWRTPEEGRDPAVLYASIISQLHDAQASDGVPHALEGGEASGGSCGEGAGLLQQVAAFKSKMAVLEMEIEEKRNVLEGFQSLLAEAKGKERQEVSAVSQKWESAMQSRTASFEQTELELEKRAGVLQKEKESFKQECATLTEEMEDMQARHTRELLRLEEESLKKLARQRQNLMLAEKTKREEWEKQKVKDIKEMTVRGLEPELERIVAQRGRERQQLQACHQGALERQRSEISQQAEQRMQEECQQLLANAEEEMQRERALQRQHMDEEQARLEQQVSEMRLACQREVASERQLGSEAREEQQQQHQALMLQLRDSLSIQHSAKAEMMMQEVRASAANAEQQQRMLLAQAELQARHAVEESERHQHARAKADHACSEAIAEGHHREAALQQLKVNSEGLVSEHRDECRRLVAAEQAKAEQKHQLAESQLESACSKLHHLEARESASEKVAVALREHLTEERTKGQRLALEEAELKKLKAAADASLRQLREENQQLRHAHRRQQEIAAEEIRSLDSCLDEERARRLQQGRESRRVEEAVKEACKRQEMEALSEAEASRKRSLHAKDEVIDELRTRYVAAESKAQELERLVQRQRNELLDGMRRNLS